MKRVFIVIVILGLFLFQLSANTPYAMDSQPPVLVQFSAIPFVRIGFSRTAVVNSVEPSSNYESAISVSYDESTDTVRSELKLYAYCQAFTKDKVIIGISGESLTGDAVTFDWHADFVGNEAPIKDIVTSFSSNSGRESILLDENTLVVDTSRPRYYCWGFEIVLDNKGGQLPLLPETADPVYGSVTISVISGA